MTGGKSLKHRMEFIMKIGFAALFTSSVLGSLAAKFIYDKAKNSRPESEQLHLFTYLVTAKEKTADGRTIIASGYVIESGMDKAIDMLTTEIVSGSVESLEKSSDDASFEMPSATIKDLCENTPVYVTVSDEGPTFSGHDNPRASISFVPSGDGITEYSPCTNSDDEDKKDAPAENKSYHKWTFSAYKAKETVESSGTPKFEKTGYPLAIGHVTVSRNTDDMTRSELVCEIMDSMPSINFYGHPTDHVYGSGKPSIEFFVTNTEMSLSYGLKKNMENSGGLYFVAEDTGKIVSSESSDIILIESAD